MTGPAQPSKCPICGKAATAEAAPFCSDRCRKVDLNRWLGGVYAVKTEELPDPGQEGDE